jgi:hypothetical protein
VETNLRHVRYEFKRTGSDMKRGRLLCRHLRDKHVMILLISWKRMVVSVLVIMVLAESYFFGKVVKNLDAVYVVHAVCGGGYARS